MAPTDFLLFRSLQPSLDDQVFNEHFWHKKRYAKTETALEKHGFCLKTFIIFAVLSHTKGASLIVSDSCG